MADWLQIRKARVKVPEARDDAPFLPAVSAGLATLDRTSPIPKSPMATATNSIPLKSDIGTEGETGVTR